MQSGNLNVLEAKPLECASLLAPWLSAIRKGGSELPHFHEKVGDVKAQSQ